MKTPLDQNMEAIEAVLKKIQEVSDDVRSMHKLREFRKELRMELDWFYCSMRDKSHADQDVIGHLANLAEKHGFKAVDEWINIAANQLPDWKSDTCFIKYIYGIRRKMETMPSI